MAQAPRPRNRAEGVRPRTAKGKLPTHMNRSIALFVALAVLVAHSLAIRTNSVGNLAPPYDQAFVAYRLASNLVVEGQWSWSPGQSGFDSYASPLWVVICAVAERLYISVNFFVRVIGVLATATSFILASRFHADRTASLITPMLLAISGMVAAAAVSGTETALLTALVTLSFLAFERDWNKTLGLALLLCGLTRGEGWVLALLFFALRLVRRRRRRRGTSVGPPSSLTPFLAPVVGILGMTALRWHWMDEIASPWLLDLITIEEGELASGLAYVKSFFVSAASPLLVVYSLWYLLRRYLSATGIRALLVFLVWSALIIVQGGGTTPFCESMVPVLPLILIAAQEGMITALNSAKPYVRAIAQTGFVVAVLASTLASKHPADLGPIPMARWQRAWMAPGPNPRFGFEDYLGRRGLDEEVEATEVLRDIGIYMRDHVDPRRTVLTPWPGSIAYLSHLPVLDLLGRATPAPPRTRTTPTRIHPHVDILAALAQGADYIVPFPHEMDGIPALQDLATQWWQELDEHHDEPGRLEAITAALQGYELITIPLQREAGSSANPRGRRACILRSRALDSSPVLHVSFEGGVLRVELEHHGAWQIADLRIWGEDKQGTAWSLTPNGRFVQGMGASTRSNLVLSDTGARRMLLMTRSADRPLPDLVTLRAALLNPDTQPGAAGTEVSREVQILPR